MCFKPKWIRSRNGSLLFFALISCSAILTSFPAKADTYVTDGVTPMALAVGAPQGSYGLSGFDNIDYFNGSPGFHLPILKVQGRGGVGYTMFLTIEQRWLVNHPHGQQAWYNPSWFGLTVRAGYGPGFLQRRMTEGPLCPISPTAETSWALTRLIFAAPDGTEHELRDQSFQGAPRSFVCAQQNRANRGTVFTSVAGEAMTFVSDTSITDVQCLSSCSLFGYLRFADGTTYRIDGGVTWMRDRNGNKISFVYGSGVTTITDSLNRLITITYNVNDGPPYGICDRITYKGFGGATRTIRVSTAVLSSSLRAGFTIQDGTQLFPELLGAPQTGTVNPTVTTALWLPDGRSYQFFYNSYAELARVVLPTGGAYEYDYIGHGKVNGVVTTSGVRDGPSAYPCVNTQFAFHLCQDIYRRIIERREYATGGSGGTFSSRETIGLPATTYSTTGGPYIEVGHFDSAGSIVAAERHYYNGDAESSIDSTYNPNLQSIYPSWQLGTEVRTEQVAVGGGPTILRRRDDTFALGQMSSWSSSVGYNPHVTQSVMTLVDSNQVSKQTFSYDQFDNKTDTFEYEYGTGAAGALIRRYHTDFLVTNTVNGQNYATNTAIHIRNLPVQEQVFDTGGAEAARTTYEYDNYAADANHAPLLARAGISGLDAAYSTGFVTRGNATGVARWVLSGSTPLNTYRQYDVAGNAVKKLDPLSHLTTFDFSDRYGAPDSEARSNTAPVELAGQSSYAFHTLATNSLGQAVYTQYDYYLGKPVNQEDLNAVVSSVSYNDLLDRPNQISRAVNTTAKNQSTLTYDDPNLTISTWTDFTVFGDNALKKAVVYDGVGRVTQTRLDSDPEGVTYVDTTYDAVNRTSAVSNPHRTGTAPTDGSTTYNYDGLGRVTKVIPPDGSSSANNITTAYSGNCATTTDEAGKGRKSCTDSLGRLTQVFEDSSGLNYETDYAYDVLDNLHSVTQKGSNPAQARVRTYTYDSLSRLVCAANPEVQAVTCPASAGGTFPVGAITYTYDASGNVATKTAPKPNQTGTATVTATYTYDPLNRLTQKSYNDGATATVKYGYDHVAPSGCTPPTLADSTPLGYRTSLCDGSGSTAWSHDVMGRIITKKVKIDTFSQSTTYAYNLDGSVSTETYPTSHVLSYGYNGTARPISLTDTTASTNYVSTCQTTPCYAPPGSLLNVRFGVTGTFAGITVQNSYNKRLQPITLSATSPSATVFSLSYDFHLGAGNNGNVYQIVNNRDGNRTQNFLYDSLNRIQQAYTNGPNWGETFSPTATAPGVTPTSPGIDAWGNLTNRSAVTGKNTYEPLSASATTQNRLTGFGYDAAGNMTSNGSASYTYDAENRLITAAGYTYSYDGDGNRVKKTNGSTGIIYWRDASSEVIDDANLAGTTQNEYVFFGGRRIARRDVVTGVKHYYFSDHLGSASVITSATGAIQEESDYFPYGGEIAIINGDPNTYKFTGKEHDSESGLDNFGARYDASSLARFLTPDAGNMHFGNPQSLNLYTLDFNNPLRFVDPDGNDPIDATLLDHILHFTQWAEPLADAQAKSILEFERNHEPMVITPRVASDLGGNCGMCIPGHIMNDMADDALDQLREWANSASTTVEEIDAATGAVDRNLRSLGSQKEDDLLDALEDYIGVVPERVPGKNAAEKVVRGAKFGVAVLDSYTKYLAKRAQDILDEAAKRKKQEEERRKAACQQTPTAPCAGVPPKKESKKDQNTPTM